MTSAKGGKIGSVPRPGCTKPVDFGEWAADYIEWGSQEGQPPAVRVLVHLLQMVTGTGS